MSNYYAASLFTTLRNIINSPTKNNELRSARLLRVLQHYTFTEAIRWTTLALLPYWKRSQRKL